MAVPLTRRTLLKWAMASGGIASLTLPGCCLPSDRGREPFATWREVQQALRSSPNHLLQRSEALIAAKDAAGLEALVRDRVRLIPGRQIDIGDTMSASSYGPDYALRCGAGTARERADLLVQLLTAAGATDATVMTARVASGRAEAVYQALYDADLPDPPLLEVPESTLSRWASVLGEPEREANTTGDADALVETLWSEVPPDAQPTPTFRSNKVSVLPVVHATIDGQPREFRSLYPGLGAADLQPDASAAKAVQKHSDVAVRLLGYRAGERQAEVLVEGTWPADQVVGKHLHLSTRPMVAQEALGIVAPSQVRAFVPTLLRVDSTGTPSEEDAVMGQPFSTSGETIVLDANKVGSRELQAPSGHADQVATLEVIASVARWPTVDLMVKPKRADGTLVEGLAPGDFKLTDDGPQPLLLQGNADRPKVLVLYDTSLSMPLAFRGRVPEFFTELTTAIKEAVPKAQLTSKGVGSNLWASALKGVRSDADVVVYVTDGHSSDKEEPWMEAALANGPAFVLLAVAGANADQMTKIASYTQAQILRTRQLDEAVRAVTEHVEQVEASPVRISYQSTATTLDPRTLTLAMTAGAATSTATYTPAEIEPTSEGIGLVGLTVEVSIGRYDYRSHLVGWSPAAHNRGANKQDERDTWHQLFGEARVYVEGEGTQTEVMLDDLLTNRIAREPLVEALEANDIDAGAALATLNDGRQPVEGRALSLLGPLQLPPERRGRTYHSGPRVAVTNRRFGTNTATMLHSVDLLRTSEIRCTDADRAAAGRHVAAASMQVLYAESTLYAQSAFRGLQDGAFTHREAALKADGTTGDDRQWARRWLPGRSWLNLNNHAGVHLHKSGNFYGVLGHGHGGGASAESIERQLKELDAVLDTLAFGLGVAGVWTPALGIVAQYGKLLARLYAVVTEALIVMNTGDLDAGIVAALQGFACNIYKELVFGLMGPAGTYMAGLDALIGQMTGGSLVECPT